MYTRRLAYGIDNNFVRYIQAGNGKGIVFYFQAFYCDDGWLLDVSDCFCRFFVDVRGHERKNAFRFRSRQHGGVAISEVEKVLGKVADCSACGLLFISVYARGKDKCKNRE